MGELFLQCGSYNTRDVLGGFTPKVIKKRRMITTSTTISDTLK